MADIRSKVSMLYSLEPLSAGGSVIHRIHPLAKLSVTMVYLFAVASMGKYELTSFAPFLFYPVCVIAIAEIPLKMLLKRTSVALPFCFFAGVSNLIFDRQPLFRIGIWVVTLGMVSFLVLLIRCLLCVSAILILVSVTPFTELTDQFRRLHVPNLLIMLLEMTYRYVGVLAEEASSMVTAYRLRGNGAKWPELKQFGPFVGQLLLRSAARAERVYHAMQCRLYRLRDAKRTRPKWQAKDWVFLFLGCGSSVFFRLFDVTTVLGGAFL